MSFIRIIVFTILLSCIVTQVQSKNVLILGNLCPALDTVLFNQGHAVSRSTSLLTDYSPYEVVVLLHIPGDTQLANWVKSGGVLIVESDAAVWALNSARLLGPVYDSGGIQNISPIFNEIFTGSKVVHATVATADLSLNIGTQFTYTIGSFRVITGTSAYQVIAFDFASTLPIIIAE